MSRSSKRRKHQVNRKVRASKVALSKAASTVLHAQMNLEDSRREQAKIQRKLTDAEQSIAQLKSDEFKAFRIAVNQHEPFRYADQVYAIQVLMDLRSIRHGLFRVSRGDRPLIYPLQMAARQLVDQIVREAEKKIMADHPGAF